MPGTRVLLQKTKAVIIDQLSPEKKDMGKTRLLQLQKQRLHSHYRLYHQLLTVRRYYGNPVPLPTLRASHRQDYSVSDAKRLSDDTTLMALIDA